MSSNVFVFGPMHFISRLCTGMVFVALKIVGFLVFVVGVYLFFTFFSRAWLLHVCNCAPVCAMCHAARGIKLHQMAFLPV
jgi:hypothetical protein